jgi:hypothetical protein
MLVEALTLLVLRAPYKDMGPTFTQWQTLRMCESSNRTNAVSRTGKYRGLYQFDLPTWESVGGVGDPAKATRAEQHKRAMILHSKRGWKPWPECGKLAAKIE